MKKLLIAILILAALGVLGILGGVAGLYYWASKDLPNFKSITDYKPALVTTVYARDNRILGYFYREKRFLVRLGEMPDHLPQAFLAAEDASFYQHDGVDLHAIGRAFFKNLKAGGIVQGGSTITQQIIKRLLLTSEKSYERKLKEAILAYRLERYLSKDEILTIYLNQIYLGGGAYGVEAAARTYFGKHVNELSLAESALLAGLPQAPSKYNPYLSPEMANSRKVYVLNRLLGLEWISREEYEQAMSEPLTYKSMDDPSWGLGAYYLEEVRRWLIDYLSYENMHKLGLELDRYGEDAVYESGLHVYTAIDLDHQAAAERALRKGLEDSSKRRGWQGPLAHLEPDGYDDFISNNATVPETLQAGDWLQVLVTKVDSKHAKVRSQGLNATIPVESMHWCRKPDPDTATDYIPAIKDANEVVKAGDVIWASVPVPDKPKSGEETAETTTRLLAPSEVTTLKIEQKPDVQGALVSLEPPTGEMVALVGGYSFSESQFNRATQAQRQPGSAFKPIVYSAAMDNGFTPASMVLDAPFVYHDYAMNKVWRPENYEGKFFGPTLLRTALVKSRNLVTIRVAQKLGVDTIIQRAKALGLDPEFPHNLSVSLGSVAVTLLDLCEAYTAFARGGSIIKPRMILSVRQAWGEELYLSEPEITEAISPQTAFIMVNLMKQVVQDGTGWRARILNRPVAGKTGTTNEEQDAWYMGYAPYLLTGIYVGFDQLQPMGQFETGSRAASPIWVDYRVKVEENYPEQDFPTPEGIVFAKVDAKTGLLAGPTSEESYFLPFQAGTEPTDVAQADARPGDQGSKAGEDLFKQVF